MGSEKQIVNKQNSQLKRLKNEYRPRLKEFGASIHYKVEQNKHCVILRQENNKNQADYTNLIIEMQKMRVENEWLHEINEIQKNKEQILNDELQKKVKCLQRIQKITGSFL